MTKRKRTQGTVWAVREGRSFSEFPLLCIQPLLGRGFLPDEEVLGKNNVVLLSYELWQRRFGGEPGIIGQSLTLDMVPRTAGPDGERDLWSPLAFFPFELLERRAHNFLVFGRLKTNVTLQQARLEMDLVARRMAESHAEDRGWGAEIHPLHEIVVGNSQPSLAAEKAFVVNTDQLLRLLDVSTRK